MVDAGPNADRLATAARTHRTMKIEVAQRGSLISLMWAGSIGRMADRKRYKAMYLAKRANPEQQPCVVPGCIRKADRHHPDYSKPTEIKWLCREHHQQIHSHQRWLKKKAHYDE